MSALHTITVRPRIVQIASRVLSLSSVAALPFDRKLQVTGDGRLPRVIPTRSRLRARARLPLTRHVSAQARKPAYGLEAWLFSSAWGRKRCNVDAPPPSGFTSPSDFVAGENGQALATERECS